MTIIKPSNKNSDGGTIFNTLDGEMLAFFGSVQTTTNENMAEYSINVSCIYKNEGLWEFRYHFIKFNTIFNKFGEFFFISHNIGHSKLIIQIITL